jgi:hypothetical protein
LYVNEVIKQTEKLDILNTIDDNMTADEGNHSNKLTPASLISATRPCAVSAGTLAVEGKVLSLLWNCSNGVARADDDVVKA